MQFMIQNNHYSIQKLPPSGLKRIYKKIRKDFAPGEYPPYMVLYRHLKNNIQQGFLLYIDGAEAAYAICAGQNPNGFMLLSLLAVYPEYRGEGIGTAFISKLKEIYADKKGIIVEVEKPEAAKDGGERAVREKRIRFYRKMGFEQVTGIEYSIWNVPLHLMVCPGGILTADDIGGVMHDIYLDLMGSRLIHMMNFRKAADC